MPKSPENQYRVLNLYGENVKRLTVIDITPEDDIITLNGENGEGKSTVLDCIRFALGGKDAIDDMPIRHGEEEARIILDLGDIIVKRRFTLSGEYISVETPDGARFPEPQKKLNEMLGAISFDPLQFTRMDAKKQYETLRGLVKIAVDIDALDAANKEDFAERTDVNRRVKELQVQVSSLIVPEDVPDESVDVSALTAELLGHKQALSNYNELERGIVESNRDIVKTKDQIYELQEHLEMLQGKLEGREKAFMAAADKLPAEGRIDEITETVKTATETNAGVARKAEKRAKQAILDVEAKKADALSAAIDKRNAEKIAAMEGAEMPVKGLSFSDGVVLYDAGQGPVPFSQASKAQKISISTAIAMAMNPAVRIVLIEDASLLDDESMAVVKDMAKKNGFQIWLECVKTSDPLAIHIVDGSHAGAVKRETKPKKTAKAGKEAA